MRNCSQDGKVTEQSEFESDLYRTLVTSIKESHSDMNEMALLWLYCKSWGVHANHVLSQNGFWKFNRDHLRQVLLDLCFPDPDGTKPTELLQLLKARLENDNKDPTEWSNAIYKESVATNISKRELFFSCVFSFYLTC